MRVTRQAMTARPVSYFAFQRTCAWLAITLTPEEDLACRYLESQGFQFCVHFGVANCVAQFQTHFASAPAQVAR